MSTTERLNWTMEQWMKFAWYDESCCLLNQLDGWVHVLFTWGRDALWQEGRLACYALDNVLLGNPGSWQLCYFDMYHLPKDCCRPQTPLHGNGVSCWLWPGLCTLPHCKNSLGMVWGTRVQGVALASKLPRSQSICVTIICVIQSMEASPHNLQDLKEWFTQKFTLSFTHPQAIHVYAFLLSDEYNRSYIK